MKTVILAAIIAELLVLIVFAALKKLTRNQFFVIAGVAVVLSAVLIISGAKNTYEITSSGEKDYIYMAAKLAEGEHYAEALQALERVDDKGNEVYSIKALRGLVYNRTDACQTARLYLSGAEEENEMAVLKASEAGEQADEVTAEKIISTTLASFDFSDGEKTELEAEMKTRFLGAGDELEADIWFKIKNLVDNSKYTEAYQLAAEGANGGDFESNIVLAEMYVLNYNGTFGSDDDEEYRSLMSRAIDARITAGRILVELEHSEEAPDEDRAEELQAEYDKNIASFNIAMDELNIEAEKRAIRFLEDLAPVSEENAAAYNLELAKLYYQCGEEDTAAEYLDHVFNPADNGNLSQLALNAKLLKEAYLESVYTGEIGEFYDILDRMIKSLYMGIWPDGMYTEFRQYVYDWLRDSTKGLRIDSISLAGDSEIGFELATTDSELELTAENLFISDASVEITDFSIEKNESAKLSICYVLDISGSMSGTKLTDSKKAVSASITELEESMETALVSFSNSAEVRSELSGSRYAAATAAETIKNAYGGTNIPSGLRKAADVLENAEGKKVILLLSDGYDQYGEYLSSALSELIDERITVYSIGIGGCDEEYLRSIAEKTGGTYIYVNDTSSLGQVYSDLNAFLSNTYSVRYSVNTDGSEEVKRLLYVRLSGTEIQTGIKYAPEELVESTEPVKVLTGSSDLFRQQKGE